MDAERSRRLLLRRAGFSILAVLSLSIVLSLGAQGAAAAGRSATAATAVPTGGVDPDTLPKSSADAVTIVRWLSPGLYQLDVENTSGVGYIDEFNWVPPTNMTVTAVTSTEGGKCTLVGGDIDCNGKMAPPKCTCQAGGELVVNFTAKGQEPTFANGYWTYYGIVGSYLQIERVTPVPYHIPSFSPNPEADLPLCKKGQTSSKKSPCV